MTLLLGPKMLVMDMQSEIKKKLAELTKSSLQANLSLNVFCNGRVLQPNRSLSEMSDKIRDEDGFVYVTYAEMDTF